MEATTDMKLSQPKSARTINTARVLASLRTTPGLSKADLARDLGLNKVSTGEIVDDLISQGLVKETGKVESTNGRRPTSLAIVPDAKYVLSVDIGRETQPLHFATFFPNQSISRGSRPTRT